MAIPTTKPKSSHTSDQLVQPFLQPDFDPATYLNTTLPSLSLSNTRPANTTSNNNNAIALPDLSIQTQALLSQLNAQTNRLSNSLTQLTDEIIRSGSRLAYEVEVLRGETTGLTDSLENGLKRDVELLAPPKQATDAAAAQQTNPPDTTSTTSPPEPEPEYLQTLRTLSTLRARLDSVIRIFGAATAWPIAPSEVSSGGGGLASNFISVSAPEATQENASREAKAKEYTEALRSEINSLLSSNDVAGLEAAAERVEELRILAEVWRGTAEEKARSRVVEGLGRLVEERQRGIAGAGRRGDGGRRQQQPERAVDMRYGDLETKGGEGGYGFLQNLRNFKEGMYLD